ncbi:hypothetical protein BaRGS_00005889 [Batillaria attramentaria]|uniref:Uncharacterized protein n=1 Tax=Batillaria attramentaria TaxID=370345 RepID=A0ABD0LTI6_9CAEN
MRGRSALFGRKKKTRNLQLETLLSLNDRPLSSPVDVATPAFPTRCLYPPEGIRTVVPCSRVAAISRGVVSDNEVTCDQQLGKQKLGHVMIAARGVNRQDKT